MDDESEDQAPPPAERAPAEREVGEGRKRTVTGALMAGIALGLREVFEPEHHDRTAIEQPAPEQPDEPQRYEIHLDPVAPEASFAIYRPWLEGEGQPVPAAADADPADTPDPAPIPPPTVEKPGGGGMGALGG